MKAVLHLPVAEQYPSKTATVDSFASKRTSGMSGGLLRSAQVRPLFGKVRAEFFAGDLAGGGALDVGATLGWYRSNAANPLIYYRGRYTKAPSQFCLATDDLACAFYWLHAEKCIAMLTQVSSHALQSNC